MEHLVYWGQLNEVGITLCNSLSADYDVTAFTSAVSPYDLKCDCYDKKKVTEEEMIREINPASILYFSSPEEDIEELNTLLALSGNQGGVNFMIIREADFFRKTPSVKSLEEILCDEYATDVFHPFVIHCSRLYGNREMPVYLQNIYSNILKDGRLYLSHPGDAYCDVMHVEDLCSLVRLILLQGPGQIQGRSIQVQSGYPFRHQVLVDFLKDRYDQIYVEETDQPFEEADFEVYSSDQWSPGHNFTKDLDMVFYQIEEDSQLDHRLLVNQRKKRIPDVIKYLCMMFCAEAYTHYIPTASDLQYVDARTLFIICSSLFFGKNVGFLSALICSITNVTGCLAKGVHWYEIFYNIDNWIPLAAYFSLAALFGMYKDYLSRKLAVNSATSTEKDR